MALVFLPQEYSNEATEPVLLFRILRILLIEVPCVRLTQQRVQEHNRFSSLASGMIQDHIIIIIRNRNLSNIEPTKDQKCIEYSQSKEVSL
jgi:hypothetical protein